MIVYLLACSAPGSEPFAVETAPIDSADAWGAVATVTTQLGDARVVELDSSGKIVADLHLSQILAAEWASLDPKPALTDVQPIAGGTFLLPVFGVGLIEVDRSGRIVWRHNDPAVSHDADRLPNGNTLYARPWVQQGEDAVIEVDSAGNTVWSWSGVEAYGSDPRFDGYLDEGGAWLHVNAVQRLDDGRTSVCIRNFNTVALVSAEGALTREITFTPPEGTNGPQTVGNLLGTRPHGAEWTSAGVAVALRYPDRALTVVGGKMDFEYRAEGLEGITDIDRLSGGDSLLAAHDRVMRVNASGETVWEWVETPQPLPGDDEEGRRARTAHAFYNISPFDTSGAPLDRD